MLPEEKELATSAQGEIGAYKTKHVVEKIKTALVSKLIHENRLRVKIYLYPEGMRKDSIDPTMWMELEPARLFVNKFIRFKFVCKDKGFNVEKPVIVAQMPVLPFARSYAAATLLADLSIDKYVNHLPFYRQLGMSMAFLSAKMVSSGNLGKLPIIKEICLYIFN